VAYKPSLIFLALFLCIACSQLVYAQAGPTVPKIDLSVVPDIAIQTVDYAEARKGFHTKLLHKGPAPFQDCKPANPPAGVSEVEFSSDGLKLHGWINRPPDNARKFPAVLFLHAGFCFDSSDWQDTQPIRDAGFIMMIVALRGENGQPGDFTMFYDELDDVKNAADFLRNQPYVDPAHLYVAGHSTGGTLTMLAAMAYPHFRAAASFSGSPNLVGYTRHALAIGSPIPFDYRDSMELQLRSAWAYAASFKCPVRIYYGADETHFALSSQPTAELARQHGLDVQAIAVPRGHVSSKEGALPLAIRFFQESGR
jgi:dipeptidyl aminopeptidase/acylaminoacyl peptidase